MGKYSVVDWRWVPDAIGHSIFFSVGALVLYAFLASVRPFPDRALSVVLYCLIAVAMVAGIALVVRAGFTVRWTDADATGLVIHEGYYGLFWKRRVIPRPEIRAIEARDRLAKGVFTRAPLSELRVTLVDGSNILLAVGDGYGSMRKKAATMLAAVGLGGKLEA